MKLPPRSVVGLTELLIALFLLSHAQILGSTRQSKTQIAADDLVRKVVANELKAHEQDQALWMYRSRKEEAGKVQVQEIIETNEAILDRLLSVDNRLLTAEQEEQEEARIQRLLSDPEEQQKKQREKQEDVARVMRLLQMLPDAFVYSYEAREKPFLRLKFKPNPGFDPPSREAQVLRSMEGTIWIDAAQKRLARLDGYLAEDVKFVGGLLGRLNKGGRFSIRQTEAAPGQWKVTSMHIAMDGRILFFKTISLQQRQYRTRFRRVPNNLSLAQAAEMLRRLEFRPAKPKTVKGAEK